MNGLDTGLPPERSVTSGGVTLNTRVVGEGSNLVAIHGGPGLDHHLLIPLARGLAGSHRVWLPDLPGHGASLALSGHAPGLRAIEDRLSAFLAALPGGVDVLVGHSMGAMIVRSLLRHRLVAPGAAVLIAPPAADQPEARSSLRRAANLIATVIPGSGDPRSDLRAHLETECSELTDDTLFYLARSRLHPQSRYRALLRNVHRANRGPRRTFEPTCPVLVLVGSEDRTTPPKQAERVAGSMPGAVLEIVEGAGHYPFLDRPAETGKAILEFLAHAAHSSG